ncbi:MAG: hypothetical protein LBE56_07400 [Tannerella sp.]|jgi:hypothetical protein|nr:hypothetical protein [Tannerella sp.]
MNDKKGYATNQKANEEKQLYGWLLQQQVKWEYYQLKDHPKGEYHFKYYLSTASKFLRINVLAVADRLMKLGKIKYFQDGDNIYWYICTDEEQTPTENSNMLEKSIPEVKPVEQRQQKPKPKPTPEQRQQAIDSLNEVYQQQPKLLSLSEAKQQINTMLLDFVNNYKDDYFNYDAENMYKNIIECLRQIFAKLDDIKVFKDYAKTFCPSDNDMLWNMMNHGYEYRNFIVDVYYILKNNNLIQF